MIFNAPSWITPKGFLFTGTELTFNSYTITATNTSSYLLLNGSLPAGLTLSTTSGVISGTPDAVLNLTSNKFTVRAYNASASIDRTFSIDIQGSDLPIWNTITITTASGNTLTTSTGIGYLPLGLNQQPYALNKQYINFQFVAGLTQSPTTAKLQYYIPDQGGTLPTGLTLSKTGKLSGILDCFTAADASTATNSTDTIYIPKEYEFYVSATDSVREQSQLFKLLAVDPNLLKYWNTMTATGVEILDISLKTQPFNYLQPPQFIIENDLGTIRAENYHLIPVNAYNPAPLVGTLTYSLVTGTTLSTNIPFGLSLDTNQGYLYGYLPYQPAYNKSYNFIIKANKIDQFTSTYTTNTFSLNVRGIVESTINWETTETLGVIQEGEISELYVKATQLESAYNIKYNKKSGNLPPGLELKNDGSIVGTVEYNSTGTYSFVITAKDVYELSFIEREFTVTVTSAATEFTQVYIKAFLSKDKRTIYSNFINNEEVFNPELIYRYFDPNFGLQQNIKIMLEFGIEKIDLDDFYSVLNTNFYRKKFYFGEIKIAIAHDQNNNVLYELIYADVIDYLEINNKSVGLTVNINSTTYYPSTLDNMRYRLENISVNNLSTIKTDEKYNPKFFKDEAQNLTSYIKFIPICYALPGQGNKILNRINFSKFNFKQFYLEADRLIVKENLDTIGERYLFFPKKNIKF